MRRRLLDNTYKRTVTGNPAVAKSVARMYPDISFPGFTTQDGTPSPENPVDIVNAQSPVQVEVMGANLFDASRLPTKIRDNISIINNNDGSFTVKGIGELSQSISINYKIYDFQLKSGTLKIDEKSVITEPVSPYFFTQGQTKDGEVVFTISIQGFRAASKEITEEMIEKTDVLVFGFYGPEGTNVRNYTIKPMVYQYGGGEWESYKQPQTVTITSDRPITKWDKMVKQNSVWGWLYKSNEVEFDGSEDEKWKYYTQDFINQFYIKQPVKHSGDIRNVYSNKFISAIIGDRSSKKEIIYTCSEGVAINTDIANTVENWKIWLQSNPIKVLYETANTEFVPLPQEQQDQINALHTNNPTTIVQNSIDTDVTLTYKTKRSLEVTQ